MDQCANRVRKKATSGEECEQFSTENIYRSNFASIFVWMGMYSTCSDRTTVILQTLHCQYDLIFTFRSSSVKSGLTGIVFGGVVFLIMRAISPRVTANLETGHMPQHVNVEDLFSILAATVK